MPAHPRKEQATLFTVIGVWALSTLAMIAYPLIVRTLGLDPTQAGVFLGGTIHDVAQVVGAGYSLSHETGDTATVVKLMRVAMLLPVILAATTITRVASRNSGDSVHGRRPPLLPWFAVGFLALAALNSLAPVPAAVQAFGNEASRWCLVIAISALGMKTQLRELAKVGLKPVLLMIGETVIAIGNAYGYEHTVTVGVVSALNRDVTLNKEISYKSLLQTDASINPGNSGGPLLNVR